MNERTLLQRLRIDISAHAQKCRSEREKLYPTLASLAPADREKAQFRIALLDLEEAEAEYLYPLLSDHALSPQPVPDSEVTEAAQWNVIRLLQLDHARLTKRHRLHVLAAAIPVEERLWASDRAKDADEDRNYAAQGEAILTVYERSIEALRALYHAQRIDT